MASNQTVSVFGAYGHTGRFVVSELFKSRMDADIARSVTRRS